MQNYYSQGNYAAAESELKQMGTLNEDQLGLMANIHLKKGDKVGYVNTIEKLAASYPKVSYWTDLLNRVVTKPGYSNRLTVDVYRLKLANGLLKKPSEFVEMAQLVIQAKAPAEALKVIDKGYKAGVLGVGAEAPRHQRLKDLAEKTLADNNKTQAVDEAALVKAKDNDGLLAMGYGLVQAGQADKGLAMMNAAIKAGGLRNPEDAKLHLGEAYAAAGKKSASDLDAENGRRQGRHRRPGALLDHGDQPSDELIVRFRAPRRKALPAPAGGAFLLVRHQISGPPGCERPQLDRIILYFACSFTLHTL